MDAQWMNMWYFFLHGTRRSHENKPFLRSFYSRLQVFNLQIEMY